MYISTLHHKHLIKILELEMRSEFKQETIINLSSLK